jgi:CheY-like chemotaxis protein
VQSRTPSCPTRFSFARSDKGLPDGSGLYLLVISKGAQGYLGKPFNLTDLRSAVEAALKQRADNAA